VSRVETMTSQYERPKKSVISGSQVHSNERQVVWGYDATRYPEFTTTGLGSSRAVCIT